MPLSLRPGPGWRRASWASAAFTCRAAPSSTLAGALVLPALFALSRIGSSEIASSAARGDRADPAALVAAVSALARQKSLRRFLFCLAMFHLANAGMLPLAASMVTLRSSEAATVMVAASILIPQFVMAALSQGVGRKARQWGRRPLLLLGFAALALRGLAFSWTGEPVLLAMFQALDGVSAAILAVVTPLVILDVTRQTGHFNLALGIAGSAVGVGAALSTTLTGYLSDHYGSFVAFNALTAFAFGGLIAVAALMPETEPNSQKSSNRSKTGPQALHFDEGAIKAHIFSAMRREVKRCSKCRLMARRDNWPTLLTASAAPISSSTMKPVTPSSTISGTAPRLNAITGQPQAMASIMTMPKGSGQSMGTSKAMAPLRKFCFCASSISPMNSTPGCGEKGRDILAEVIFVGAIDFCGDFQRQPAAAGDVNGDVRALLRRDATEKSEIARRRRLRPQPVDRQAMMHGGDEIGVRHGPSLGIGNRHHGHTAERGEQRLMFGQIQAPMQCGHERGSLARKEREGIIVEMKMQQIEFMRAAINMFQHRHVQGVLVADRAVEP